MSDAIFLLGYFTIGAGVALYLTHTRFAVTHWAIFLLIASIWPLFLWAEILIRFIEYRARRKP